MPPAVQTGGAGVNDRRHRLWYLQILAARRARSGHAGWADLVGIGRRRCPILNCRRTCSRRAGWRAKRICRTFSDCTTAARKGLVSGCFPLDPYYKQLPEAATLREQAWRRGRREPHGAARCRPVVGPAKEQGFCRLASRVIEFWIRSTKSVSLR